MKEGPCEGASHRASSQSDGFRCAAVSHRCQRLGVLTRTASEAGRARGGHILCLRGGVRVPPRASLHPRADVSHPRHRSGSTSPPGRASRHAGARQLPALRPRAGLRHGESSHGELDAGLPRLPQHAHADPRAWPSTAPSRPSNDSSSVTGNGIAISSAGRRSTSWRSGCSPEASRSPARPRGCGAGRQASSLDR